jgi:hypothetical protein
MVSNPTINCGQAAHRPGIIAAHGLRAESDVARISTQTAFKSENGVV